MVRFLIFAKSEQPSCVDPAMGLCAAMIGIVTGFDFGAGLKMLGTDRFLVAIGRVWTRSTKPVNGLQARRLNRHG